MTNNMDLYSFMTFDYSELATKCIVRAHVITRQFWFLTLCLVERSSYPGSQGKGLVYHGVCNPSLHIDKFALSLGGGIP